MCDVDSSVAKTVTQLTEALVGLISPVASQLLGQLLGSTLNILLNLVLNTLLPLIFQTLAIALSTIKAILPLLELLEVARLISTLVNSIFGATSLEGAVGLISCFQNFITDYNALCTNI